MTRISVICFSAKRGSDNRELIVSIILHMQAAFEINILFVHEKSAQRCRYIKEVNTPIKHIYTPIELNRPKRIVFGQYYAHSG